MSTDLERSELALVAELHKNETIKQFEDAIRNKHDEVSNKKTNKNHVKQKAGMDYVEFSYMKRQADKYYPMWSFKNVHINQEFLKAGWVQVTGELHFIDEGVPRVGAYAAAHRIAYKTGMSKTPENIVDLGNDVKAAVTDCMKKCFNVYMNISDDIYKNIEIVDITNDQKEVLYSMIEDCDSSNQSSFYRYVDNNVTKANFEYTAIKIAKSIYKALKKSGASEEDILSQLEEHKKNLEKYNIFLDKT